MNTKQARAIRIVVLTARFDATQRTSSKNKFKEPTGLVSSWEDAIEVQLSRHSSLHSSNNSFYRLAYLKAFDRFYDKFKIKRVIRDFSEVKNIFENSRKRLLLAEREAAKASKAI